MPEGEPFYETWDEKPPKSPAVSTFSRGRQGFPFPSSSERNSRATSCGPTRAGKQAFHVHASSGQKYFRSRRIKDISTIEKPWTSVKDPRRKWQTIIPIIGVFLGFALVAFEVYSGWNSVVNHDYCLVYSDDFSSGTLNEDIWTKEVEVGGYGNGQFEETTNTNENAFVQDGELWIKPTLQDADLITHNTVINLTAQGICTSNLWSDCIAVTNTTNGTIVNPVKSARINTKKGATIQYGRVEVEALLPEGDWLWPAIWMLPVNNTYGAWPASGEIDIAESRGNNHTYTWASGGNDKIASTLHWGPMVGYDAYYKTNHFHYASHTTFAKTYHTFGLEWTPKYLFTYVGNRLVQVLYTPFNKPLYEQGQFASSTSNGTRLVDPWSQTGRDSTPFDEDFYLILNVAVGGTNGWFKDGVASKPWVDASDVAKTEFYAAKDTWYPTWEENGQMRVKSVKMWQQAGYKGCKTS